MASLSTDAKHVLEERVRLSKGFKCHIGNIVEQRTMTRCNPAWDQEAAMSNMRTMTMTIILSVHLSATLSILAAATSVSPCWRHIVAAERLSVDAYSR
jgi:hypothetical protein